MRVNLIVEGAYPYYTGGVSSWIQHMLTELKEVEFVVQTLVVGRNHKKELKYKMPDNVIELREVYLQDTDYVGRKKQKIKMTEEEYQAFQSLFYGEYVKWGVIFRFFQRQTVSLDELLAGKEFLQMTVDYFKEHFDRIAFSDFLWTMRSMYLPLFTILKSAPIEADMYHTLSTGYAGMLGSMQKQLFHKPFLVSEHGIYTREREEEIIKAGWVKGLYKDLWIGQFKKMSQCSYDVADKVTCLYNGAKDLQIEFGCQRNKILVIPNGVNVEQFAGVMTKDEKDPMIHIGAVLRITPIKDVKTLINAFYLAKQQVPNLKLWIMGPRDEDSDYADECVNMVKDYAIPDVEFTGTVNIKEYIGKMDIMMLSSLSEGQPLAILEAYAVKKPFIATNVGNCYGLIYGEKDDYGDAGIVVPIMNVSKMAAAMVDLAQNKDKREAMGEVGYRRAKEFYSEQDIYNDYLKLYKEIVECEKKQEEGC